MLDQTKENLIKHIKHALYYAKLQNIDLTIDISVNTGLDVNVRNQQVDTIEFNNSQQINLTVYLNHQQGTAAITELTNNAIEKAILKAKSIASFTNEDPYIGLADKALMATKNNLELNLDLYHPENITAELAIEQAKLCEQAAINFNQSIVNTDIANFNYTNKIVAVGNSNDFIAVSPSTKYSLCCSAIAKDQNNLMQRDYDYTIARNRQDLLPADYIGEKAAKFALKRLGAKKIATYNNAKVLFTPRMAANLISYFISGIAGNNISNNASYLINKLGKFIFPKFINIVDDPLVIRGLGSRLFDTDGFAAFKQNIVTNGVLNNYLLNLYFAKKLKLTPNAHANGIYNLLIQASDPNLSLSYQDLITRMHSGLILTDTIGHGVNLVTGDYSKGAFGYWVENGKVAYPVEEITIAGNLLDIFNNIIAIGNDINYENNIITGSILVNNLTIAGN